jgi:hypothetical protein
MRDIQDLPAPRRFGEPPHSTSVERLSLALEHELPRHADLIRKEASEPAGQHDLAGRGMALEA